MNPSNQPFTQGACLPSGAGQISLVKTFVFLLLGVSLSPAVSPVGLLPDDKVSVVVADGERNPFGKLSAKAEVTVDNEEARIRAVIDHLPMAGVIESRSGKRVMLGFLVLEEGKILPPVVSNQKERVQVVTISEEKIEMGFLEPDGQVGSRRILLLSPSLSPAVHFRVAPPAGPKQGTLDGVLTKDEMDARR